MIAFWKSKRERMKDVIRVYHKTGMLSMTLFENYWPKELWYSFEQNN